MLPTEYNGTAGSIKDIKDHWEKVFLQKRFVDILSLVGHWRTLELRLYFMSFAYREYIMNDANWIVTKKQDVNNNETRGK